MAAATSTPASTSSTSQSTSFPLVLVAVDLACIILAALPTVVLAIVDRPYQRGFSCVDESIQYPYLGVETVPFSAVVAGGFLLNIIPMAVGEWFWSRSDGASSRSFVRNLAVSSLYKTLGAFLLGAAMSQAFTDVAKYSIGRLRPHFLHVCGLAPGFNCSAAMSGAVACTGEAHLVNEARKSFYSGHSSFAMYSMLYLALYLES
uniref:Phospholipid phosphatase 3-like n=1 Tax=Petromyzon marinus TaxID=7757 RepID=A0AAJ7WKA7_PETMA